MKNKHLRVFTMGNEKDVREFCSNELSKSGFSVEIYKDNIIAHKGKGKIYPTINAHMDCVYEQDSNKTVYHDNVKNILWSPSGIGGDDRAGCFIALSLAKSFAKIKIILTSKEESGSIGANEIKKPQLDDSAYILTLDRRGNSNLITSIGWEKLQSKKFRKMITRISRRYGYRPTDGMFSDCIVWSENGIDTCNVSVGYYDPHTLQEYINISDMYNAMQLAKDMISEIPLRKYRHNYYDDIFYPKPNKKIITYSDIAICDYCNEEFNVFDYDYGMDYYEDINHICPRCYTAFYPS